MDYLISLDLSTTSTGYAIFNFKSQELLTYGFIKSDAEKINNLKYPKKQLFKIRNIVSQIIKLLIEYNPKLIIIEEVNLHKSRLSGKTLDALHAILWEKLPEIMLEKVVYMDSDGLEGWRTRLNLRLSESDKLKNKERKSLNKKIARGIRKLPIINKKHLACAFVNKFYKLKFDVDQNESDNDIVDAIGLGNAYLRFGANNE